MNLKVLMSLKENIARKRSQQDLPINSYVKKPNEVTIHQISNSNPKFIKKNVSKKDTKLNDSRNKKKLKPSLFDVNEHQTKKEKVKHINMNEKKNIEHLDNDNKIKCIEASKFTGNHKKVNKTKKNIMIRKYNKIEINDENFTNEEKINYTNVETNNNENGFTNKMRLLNQKEKKINKNITFCYNDDKMLKKTVKSMKSSAKNVNSYIQSPFEKFSKNDKCKNRNRFT